MTPGASASPRGGWYYGWNIVAAGVLAQVACNGLLINAFSLFLKDWSTDLGTPISTLQLSLAGMGLACAITSPFMGALADAKPARWLFGVGLLAIAVFNIAMSFVTQAWQVIALYALIAPVGLGLATAITANAVVSRWFVRRLGLALGVTSFGLGAAGMLVPPLVAALLPSIDWRTIWFGAGLITAFVVIPIVMLVVRDRPTEREGLHYVQGAAGAARHHGHGGAAGGGLGFGDIIKRKNFWLLCAVYLPILAVYGGGAQNAAPIAASHGFGPQTAGMLIVALSLTHVLANLALGAISDRFGNRLPFVGLAVITAAGAAVLAVGQGLPALVVGIGLIGIGGGLFTLLAAALAVEFGSAGFGRAFGLIMSLIPVTAFAPFLIAKSQETTGSYTPALLGLAVLTLAGGAAVLLMRERRGGHLTPDEKVAALDDAVTPIA